MARQKPGGVADLRALEKVIASSRDVAGFVDPPVRSQAFMNYASAPLGAKKYDASTLTSVTAR
jgi:hypothetical protein